MSHEEMTTKADSSLVFALLDTSERIGDPVVAAKYRDFTLSWSRYGYRGKVLEDGSIDRLVERARAQGYRYVFIQGYGHVIRESRSGPGGAPSFGEALDAFLSERELVAAGDIEGDAQTWFGFRPGALLVDLKRHGSLGSPAFDPDDRRPVALPGLSPDLASGRIRSLTPTGSTWRGLPRVPGWAVIASSLSAGLPVTRLDDRILEQSYDLNPDDPDSTRRMRALLGTNLDETRLTGDSGLTDDQRAFLSSIASQVSSARRGVFLWNIESYADVETPPEVWRGPVSTLYSVSSGFKPNRILETHGFDESSRVVYFDYSERALEIRRFMIDEWNGRDFPELCRKIFAAFPAPETYYQLWDGASSEGPRWDEIERAWESELDRWGGASTFASHWERYRRLHHVLVSCDVVADAAPLFDVMVPDERAVLWWSNAFFTVYSNWYRALPERARAYRDWIRAVAERAPSVWLYGSDDTNRNVNGVRAADYHQVLTTLDHDPLEPSGVYRTEIRM